MNILIPAAGEGRRFREAGYDSKPFIDVGGGEPMLLKVTKNLWLAGARMIWLVRQEDYDRARKLKQDVEIIKVQGTTQGASCTALLAGELIDSDEPLIVCNSDQLLDGIALRDFVDSATDCDAWMVVFPATGKKWSYARCENGWVKEVAEKIEISDLATVGIYGFTHGHDFCEAAKEMMRRDIRSGGNREFYVAPVFNQLLLEGAKVKAFAIQAEQMCGLGDPESLKEYLALGR